MAHTDYTNASLPQYDSNDWIEFFNTTGAAIGFTNWFLSDDPSDLRKWAVPSNAVIAAGGWLTYDEVSGFHNPISTGFGRNKAGDLRRPDTVQGEFEKKGQTLVLAQVGEKLMSRNGGVSSAFS